MAMELLFWIAISVLIVVLAVRLYRRVRMEQSLLDDHLDESFERYARERLSRNSYDHDQAA